MALSKLSIKRLRMVKDAILAEPALYDQRAWTAGEPRCGTPACIAGWAAWMADPADYKNAAYDGSGYEGFSILLRAQSWLGLGYAQAGALFTFWPSTTSPAWKSPGTIEAAQDAAEHIERFIANGGSW